MKRDDLLQLIKSDPAAAAMLKAGDVYSLTRLWAPGVDAMAAGAREQDFNVLVPTEPHEDAWRATGRDPREPDPRKQRSAGGLYTPEAKD